MKAHKRKDEQDMFTSGYINICNEPSEGNPCGIVDTLGIMCEHSKRAVEIIVIKDGLVWSAYKEIGADRFAYNNKLAMIVWRSIKSAMGKCTEKNVSAAPFELGTVLRHNVSASIERCYTKSNKGTVDVSGDVLPYKTVKKKSDVVLDKFNGELAGIEIKGADEGITLAYLQYEGVSRIPKEIPYINMASERKDTIDEAKDDEDIDIPVRSLEEISLETDITWLKDKQYYIVDDDVTAENIFSQLEQWNYPISFDTETTGLRINMFGKINSDRSRELAEYNKNKPKDEQIRADKLVGIIFCVRPDISYYFPVTNRKFKNLYEDKQSEIRNKTIQNIKASYTVGVYRELDNDMARYWRETPDAEVTSDCILMERCRKIFTEKHIVAHNGTFECKVCHLYDILLNLKDDTMILHQIMYKFRSTTSNKGEPSNLKYLAKVELGMNQLGLEHFFTGFSEDTTGTVRSTGSKKKKKGLHDRIDFSYMTYEGSKAYAPADGDATLQLLHKYKQDLINNHSEMIYIYNVELIVSMAIAYMEFYGLRIDEDKINAVRDKYKLEMYKIEHSIRVLANKASEEEVEAFRKLKECQENNLDSLEGQSLEDIIKECREELDKGAEEFNVASPSQVADLFYNQLGYPLNSDKPSVAKKVIKPLLKIKDDDGNLKYPAAVMYSEWKKLDTLLTKFFDNLQSYMYPGGFMFPSYGQISTATGRMSCKAPNAQQFPKDITKIVVPRDNCVMMDADYSQIEYRTMVAMAAEQFLLELFKDPDNDYHTLMASLMYSVPYASVTPKMRGDAKSFNFGIPYGMGFKSLAILLTGQSGPSQVEEAKEKYELYFKDQPNVRRFFEQVKEMAMINKFTKTYWNRYRYYSFTDENGKVSGSKRAMALRQAGNAVIQGSAADIFKISVARNFNWIKANNLIGKVFIVNMVHDEQLMEMDYTKVDTQAVFARILDNMQFKVEGFPPLYVGAGFGYNWAEAKGKMAEIHPHLATQLHDEAINRDINSVTGRDRDQIINYYHNRVKDFRLNKIKDYLEDPENRGKDLHPTIGSLLNLQFTYGLEEIYEGDELTDKALEKFIEVNNVNANIRDFIGKSVDGESKYIDTADEEDEEYSDDPDELDDMVDIVDENNFALIDEDATLYGVSLQDLIREFGLMVSKERKVCGIDITKIARSKKDELIDMLAEHEASPEDAGAMQIVFLQENNVLFNTGVFVKGIDGNSVSTRLGIKSLLYK